MTTAAEQAALLRAAAAHDAPRDHVLYSMALGTGLRLSELLGLDVVAVSPDAREVRRRVVLDPATTKGGRRGGGVPAGPAHPQAAAVPGLEGSTRGVPRA